MSEKEKLNAMRKTFSGESVTDLKDEIILLKQKVADLEQSNKDRQQENFRLKKCEIALRNELRSVWTEIQTIKATLYSQKPFTMEGLQQDTKPKKNIRPTLNK